MSQPVLTVGIPTYNRADYLRVAIDSVLSQSFEHFELLVVDNASTDGTPELMSEITQRDPRVRYFRNETNLGMGGNWWRVAELARADYLKYLMDDDILKPGCLEAFAEAVQRHPSLALVACLGDQIDDHGAPLPAGYTMYAPDHPIPGQLMLRFLLNWTNQIGCPTNVMFRVEGVRLHSETIWRQANNSWSPDFEMMVRVLANGDFLCINRPLVSIRHHSSSLTSGMNAEVQQDAEGAVLRSLVEQIGRTPETLAIAERHMARTAFVRGMAAIYGGRWHKAFRFFRRWAASPERFRASSMAMAHSKGQVVLPAGLLGLLKKMRSGNRKQRSYEVASLHYRFPEMARFWNGVANSSGGLNG